MNEEHDHRNIWIGLLVITLLGGWLYYSSRVSNLEDQVASLQHDLDLKERRLDEYQDALTEANSQIEEANSIIDDARGYAWSSYDEMGEALDNLETVETVSEP